MPNPIKGEVIISISGKQLPLVFNFDAIAKIEAKYDASVLAVQEDMSRIEKIYDFLEAGLGGEVSIEELKKAELPPILKLQGLIQQALYIAYFGHEKPKEKKAKDPKKKQAKRKKR